MDSTNSDRDIDGECSVAEDAFWHSNMDLYYGYDTNELVEVEHEPYKYWLARIVYNYKQLLLLRWECDYGEFWLDTSNNSKRRCYPPGYYLQPQLKSQYEFKRPPKPPTRKDPYANIKNVQDLLLAEEPLDQSDSAKCKNIPFKPEDAEELEAALQTLNELNCDTLVMDFDEKANEESRAVGEDDVNSKAQSIQDNKSASSSSVDDGSSNAVNFTIDKSFKDTKAQQEEDEAEKESRLDEEKLHTCKTIRHKAIEEYKSKIVNKLIIPKPKQFYDLGGVNPERLFVPGAILEICHHKNSTRKQDGATEQYTLCHWFAIIVENIGGRLTLRWLLSDDPKFKQGRLEMKSIVFSLVEEESNQNSNSLITSMTGEPDQVKKIPAKEVSFRLHYCHPSISTIGQGQALGRDYSLPEKVESAMFSTLEQPQFSYLLQLIDTQDVPTGVGELVKVKSKRMIEQTRKRLYDAVFDARRINLDKDRPLIDYVLHVIRKRCPNYLDTTNSSVETNQEVLVSTPKTTKILRGIVKHVFEPGVYLIEAQTRSDKLDSKINFIYPYDTSYTVLPLSWGVKYKDCLNTSNSSTHNEGNASNPQSTADPSEDPEDNSEGQISDKESNSSRDPGVMSPATPKQIPEDIKPNISKITDLSGGDKEEPNTYLASNNSDHETKPQVKVLTKELYSSRNSDLELFKMDDTSLDIIEKFKISNQLEVVHPSSDLKICSGKIRRISPPLLWIQISNDSYTVVPFNSTDIYPLRWCESHNHPLIYMLPIDVGSLHKNGKKNDATRNAESSERWENQNNSSENDANEDEFNIDKISDKQDDINDLITESAWCTRIFFNHKCFSGPALSKGKICSLPQYVGPGPVRLVMEEVVTKVISVAYVPPRILNDLSSKNFEDLLVSRNIINTSPLTFKAKYQKRVYREELPVIINAEDVEAFCECICEHLKCCYNLFGPNLYDGDDCPGHCRGLTKSNKFMKRAIYYREKARLGEFIPDANKKGSNKNGENKRQNYGGRGSQESTSSSRCKTPKVTEPNDISDPLDSNSNSEQKVDDSSTNQDAKSNQDSVQTPLAISDESESADGPEPASLNPNPEELSPPSSGSDQENQINLDVPDRIENFEKDKHDDKNLKTQIDQVQLDSTNGETIKRKRDQTEVENCLDNEETETNDKLSEQCLLTSKTKRHSPNIDRVVEINDNRNSLDELDISKNDITEEVDAIDIDFDSEVFNWSIQDVYRFLRDSKYSQFAQHFRDQQIDGPAFLLLDVTTLEEHFFHHPCIGSQVLVKPKDICSLSEFIKDLGSKVKTSMKSND